MNALPLTYGLKPQEVELLHRPPAQLFELLEAGQVEAALLPIVNYFDHPDLKLIPNLAIACQGPVKSVGLYFEGADPQKIRSIFLDPESRTSHALLKVILKNKYGHDLEALNFSSDPHAKVDAKLLIGDKTFDQTSSFLDLGEEWFEWQKRPFVFAAWMSFQSHHSDLVKRLQESQCEGLQHIDEIISTLESPLAPSLLKDYFTKNLHYTMGEFELDGIRRFYELSKPIQGYKHELHFKFVS